MYCNTYPVGFDHNLAETLWGLNCVCNYKIQSVSAQSLAEINGPPPPKLHVPTVPAGMYNYCLLCYQVSKWYSTFKAEYPELWDIAAEGMREIAEFEQNPPDLSHMDHPIHPIRKTKK